MLSDGDGDGWASLAQKCSMPEWSGTRLRCVLLELCAAGPAASPLAAYRACCVWRADTSAPKGSGTAPHEWLVLGATCACDPTRTTWLQSLLKLHRCSLSLSHPPFLQLPAPATRSLLADTQATTSGCASGSLTHFSSSFADHFSPSLSVRSPLNYTFQLFPYT